MKITLKVVRDSVSEEQNVKEEVCSFAILERSMPTRPLLYVSTKRLDSELNNLPDWTLICRGGGIQRFSVKLSKEDFFGQLQKLYENNDVLWVN